MKLGREVVITAIVSLIVAVVLMGTVGAEVSGPLTTQEPRITNLHMSTSCLGPAVDIFPAGTMTVYLVFDYSGMQGQQIRIEVLGPKFFVEAEHPAVIKSEGWTTESWPEANGEQYVKACGALNPNATLTTTFKADKILMAYIKDTDGGIAEVQVDDRTPIMVDMCAAARSKAQMVIASGLGPELHTITLKVLTQTSSCGGSCVGVDRFWNEVNLYEAARSYSGEGTECISLTYGGAALPPGSYTTNIKLDSYPMKTLLWYVQPGGPGEISNLRMSSSPGGPAKTQFIEGTRTVWAIFDYANMAGSEVGIDISGPLGFSYKSARETLTGTGTKVISVTHPYITGFPVGEYRTHVVKDGYVDAVKNWSVLHGVYLPMVLKNPH